MFHTTTMLLRSISCGRAVGAEEDPREEELAKFSIRVVGYEERNGGFDFRVATAPA